MPRPAPSRTRTRTLRASLLAGLGLLAAAPPAATAQTQTQTPAAIPAPPPRPTTAPATATAPAEPAAAPDPKALALFARPAITEALQQAVELAQGGDLAGAGSALDALLGRYPGDGETLATRAVVAMLSGDAAGALGGLEAAAAAGRDIRPLLADPLFAPLTTDAGTAARTAALEALAPIPATAPIPARVDPAGADGQALVSAANTAWNPETGRLEVRFAFPDKPEARVVARRKVAAYEIVAELARRGRAAGNHGDLYDNRDRGHSTLDLSLVPRLTPTAYDAAAKAADADYGLADRLTFDRPVVGNSSTAVTGEPYWRSLPRFALTEASGIGPVRLAETAAANGLYVYPAHKDFTEEGGDLFPANTPYVLVSRGSSGSDRPFLEAAALILAALRPDTKARAIETHTLVPTVQMIFRRSLHNVTSRASYLSGDAHPAAFDGFQINTARMASLANSIRADAIPAEVRIRVESEDAAAEGIDFFGAGLTEQLFDTPAAVARIWRSGTGRRTMIVSAADSRDVNGRPLAFTWALLQGDPAKVRIEPLDGGVRARITLDWHDPFRISEDVPVTTSRVDIGVFAGNGAHDSAPAILSWYFPPDATRSYAPGPEGAPRLVAIDHRKPAAPYVDPALLPAADWEDRLHRDADGRLTGWTRTRTGQPPEEFDAAGRRLTADGGTVAVAYPIRRQADGRFAIEEIEQQDPPAQ